MDFSTFFFLHNHDAILMSVFLCSCRHNRSVMNEARLLCLQPSRGAPPDEAPVFRHFLSFLYNNYWVVARNASSCLL